MYNALNKFQCQKQNEQQNNLRHINRNAVAHLCRFGYFAQQIQNRLENLFAERKHFQVLPC